MAEFSLKSISKLERYSLPDWAFYPLIAMMTAALIWGGIAYRPNSALPVVTNTSFVISDEALVHFVPAPGTRYSYVPSGYGQPVARVSASATLETAGQLSAGVTAFLPETFERAVIGQRIRVRIHAEAVGSSPVEFAIGYFTTANGDSGWNSFVAGTSPQTFEFEWTVPQGEANANESIGIWPDISGQGKGLLVHSFRVDILENATSPS